MTTNVNFDQLNFFNFVNNLTNEHEAFPGIDFATNFGLLPVIESKPCPLVNCLGYVNPKKKKMAKFNIFFECNQCEKGYSLAKNT